MLVMTPVQCGQGCQHNTGKDTNAASARPPEAKSPRNNARYGDEATGKDDDHNNTTTHTDVLQLCLGWADASLQCWGQCQHDEGKEASATLVTMPVQCDINSAMLARTPARRRQGRLRNAGKTTSARLARHESHVAGERRRLRQQKPQTTTMSTMMTPRTLTCHDCTVMRRMPVCNAYGNAGTMWVTSPAQQGQRCPCNAGSDAGAMLVKTTAQCW
jgi:hypothetical protein